VPSEVGTVLPHQGSEPTGDRLDEAGHQRRHQLLGRLVQQKERRLRAGRPRHR
jgi:hypothetical protein